IAGRFAMAGIPLHIVLLHNPAVTAEPEMAPVVRPLWPDMAAATGGRFYQVEKSDDLPHIFHEIMVSLTGRETAGMVLQAPVQPPSRHTIAVQPNLAQTSFVILKSSPAITTEIFQPDGRRLAPAPTGVTYNGWPGSYEEVWSVSQPPPGDWQLRFTGQGQITVWQDDQPAPAAPTPFSTSIPTATTTPLPRQVALPSIPVASIQPTSSTVQGRTDSPTGEAGSDSTPSQLPLAEGRGQNIPSGGERIIQSDQSHFGRWFWLMLSLLVLLLFGGGGLWLKKRPGSPPVSGQLRRLAAPNGSEPALSRIDLDRFNQPQVQLGPDRTADVVLINPAAGPGLPTVTLLTRPGVETEATTYLRVDRANGSEVRLNDRQVHQACPLFDSDIIGLGEYQFRFENLRCRRPGSNRPVTAYGNRHTSSLLGR
ncbi:MAG: hypothetical protein KDI79_31755, partial [Anaerolineae bacterium]|nr:hypothetical protein [Anaerolineae bacterium]